MTELAMYRWRLKLLWRICHLTWDKRVHCFYQWRTRKISDILERRILKGGSNWSEIITIPKPRCQLKLASRLWLFSVFSITSISQLIKTTTTGTRTRHLSTAATVTTTITAPLVTSTSGTISSTSDEIVVPEWCKMALDVCGVEHRSSWRRQAGLNSWKHGICWKQDDDSEDARQYICTYRSFGHTLALIRPNLIGVVCVNRSTNCNLSPQWDLCRRWCCLRRSLGCLVSHRRQSLQSFGGLKGDTRSLPNWLVSAHTKSLANDLFYRPSDGAKRHTHVRPHLTLDLSFIHLNRLAHRQQVSVERVRRKTHDGAHSLVGSVRSDR